MKKAKIQNTSRPFRAGYALSRRSGHRLCRWAAVSLMLTVSLGCAPEADDPPQWNVVLIVVDTWRADHLRLYGYDRATTPYLDELARKAVIFEEARSDAGCTFPSANSLLTSTYPQLYLKTMKDHGWAIPSGIPTLAEMLKSAGYATSAVSASPIVRANPGRQNPDGGFDAGFDEFDDSCERQPASCVNHIAFDMMDAAEEPFFLYLHYFEPHDPYQPPEEHERVFATKDYAKSWVADGGLIPLFKMLYKEGPSVEFTDEDLAYALDLYDEEILYFDSQLKELVERLKSDGTFDRTLMVLASDHGEEFMEHDHFFHCKDLYYDTVMKTPLLFWVPGLERSLTIRELAQNLDIVPTLLDYLQIDDSAYDLKGKSLRPLIEQTRSIHRYVFGMQRHARTVTDGRFKLSYNIKSGEVKLYDLDRDPNEQMNIIARRPALANELTSVLLRWVETVEGDDVEVAERARDASEVTERLRALGYL